MAACATFRSPSVRACGPILAALLSVVASAYGLVGTVCAAQIDVLPSQQKPDQSQPSRSTRSQSAPENRPATPVMPFPQGSNVREIPLPQVFRGCWAGEVPVVDSMKPLSSDANHIQWLTKSYTLCYRQVGYSGKWRLTFAEGSVARRSMVSDQRQVITVKSVAGPDRAELTAYLHFRAPQVNPFGIPTGVINTLDELTHLHCTVTPDQNAMDVQAEVFVESDDRPWVVISWHTRLMRWAG